MRQAWHSMLYVSLNDTSVYNCVYNCVMTTRALAKKAVRDEIARAALIRFQRDGYEATTVDDIAKDIGMSSRTFFRYFAAKEDVLLGRVADFTEDFQTSLAGALANNGLWDALRLAIEDTVLGCDGENLSFPSKAVQALVRATPALLARQLETFEALQRQAAEMCVAEGLLLEQLDRATTEAAIRCAFACAQIAQGSVSGKDRETVETFRTLMKAMTPQVLRLGSPSKPKSR